MASKQRQLVSEAKLRIRRISKEITDLKREMYYLEQLILKNEYVSSVRKSDLTKTMAKRRQLATKRGGKRTGSLLKAAVGGIRETL